MKIHYIKSSLAKAEREWAFFLKFLNKRRAPQRCMAQVVQKVEGLGPDIEDCTVGGCDVMNGCCLHDNRKCGLPDDFALPYPFPRNEHEHGVNWVSVNAVVSGRSGM